MSSSRKRPKVSIVFPCRNEEASLGGCIQEARLALSQSGLTYEILVSDSSTDSSPSIARKEQVHLIKHDKEGYGMAYLEAFPHTQGMYIICVDPDGSYNMQELPQFAEELEAGADMVLGNRFQPSMREESMPWLNRYSECKDAMTSLIQVWKSGLNPSNENPYK